MKTLKFLFSTVILVLITGCSNDHIPEISSDQLILGNWIVSDISISGDITLNDNNIDPNGVSFFGVSMPTLEVTAETQNYTVNFSKPDQVASNKGLSISYVVSVDEYLNTYEYSKVVENINVFNSGNWTMDYPFLTVSSNGSNEKFGFIELSKAKFTVWKFITDQITLNYYGEDRNFTTEMNALITFQKE